MTCVSDVSTADGRTFHPQTPLVRINGCVDYARFLFHWFSKKVSSFRAHGTSINVICEDIREGLISMWALTASPPGVELMWCYSAITDDTMDEELGIVCSCGGGEFPGSKLPVLPLVNTDGIVFSACTGHIIELV
jgi:hypothetical protein